jgi:hypothetical protein
MCLRTTSTSLVVAFLWSIDYFSSQALRWLRRLCCLRKMELLVRVHCSVNAISLNAKLHVKNTNQSSITLGSNSLYSDFSLGGGGGGGG